MIPTPLRAAALAACALALSGCVSLLPKSKPAQLYRFSLPATAAASAEPEAQTQAGGPVSVFYADGDFQRESAGDRMLTITDQKAAYIAESRWVAPAQVLFQQSVESAFEADPGRVRLVSRGAMTQSAYTLRLDVRNFEARYLRGRHAAPTVVIRVRAVLTRTHDRTLAGDEVFTAEVKARTNRVSAIVAAYDQALGKALGDLVDWTEAEAEPAPAAA